MSFLARCILLICFSTLGISEKTVKTVTSKKIDDKQNMLMEDSLMLQSDEHLTPRYDRKRSINDATVSPQRYNLLGILMNKVAKLTKIITFSMSEQSWNILSETIGSFLLVLFGPYTNILWPIFADASVWFFRLLTS